MKWMAVIKQLIDVWVQLTSQMLDMVNRMFFMAISIGAGMVNLVCKHWNFLARNELMGICHARQLNLSSSANTTCHEKTLDCHAKKSDARWILGSINITSKAQTYDTYSRKQPWVRDVSQSIDDTLTKQNNTYTKLYIWWSRKKRRSRFHRAQTGSRDGAVQFIDRGW